MLILILVKVMVLVDVCTGKSICLKCNCSTNIMDCFNKSLTEIPSPIPAEIKQLNLSMNHIKDIPNFILNGTHLQILDLSRNSITSLNTNSFYGLLNLTTLFLNDNEIGMNKSSYPPGIFKPLANLKILHLFNNSLTAFQKNDTYPDEELSDLVRLSVLKIDGVPDMASNLKLGKGFSLLTNLTALFFTGKCQFEYLPNDSLINVPNLKILSFRNCMLYDIQPFAFRNLTQLECLDLSHNVRLGFEKATIPLQYLPSKYLWYLNLSALHTVYQIGVLITATQAMRMQHLPITHINLDHNRIELVETLAVMYFPSNITKISFQDNKPTWGLYLLLGHQLKSLESIDASYQYQSHSPITPLTQNLYKMERLRYERSVMQLLSTRLQGQRHDSKQFVISNMLKKYISAVSAHSRERNENAFKKVIPVPPNMTFLNVSISSLDFPLLGINFGPNIVRQIDLSRNKLHTWIGPITGVQHVKWLDLSTNFCDHINKKFFSNFTNLRVLNISSNYHAPSIEADVNGALFQALTKLEILRISDSKIRSLPLKLLINQANLTVLDLSRNTLSQFTLHIDHMINLKIIDLSYNVLTSLPLEFRNFCDKQHHKSKTLVVKLEGQDLKCTCDHLDFLIWMNKNTTKFINKKKYRCFNSDGLKESIADLNNIIQALQVQCKSYTILVISLIVGIIFIFTLVISSLIYKYRWKLRYLYYLTRSKFRGYSAIGGAAQNRFDYDAFISYADEDRRLVVRDMVIKLEQEQGTQLCIHHRDFLAGEEIAANILNAVRNSKKTVIVLSRNFIASYWCIYELNMAYMESLETGRNVIILVIYEYIPMKDLPEILVEFMKKNCYIEYTDDQQGNIIFWNNLNRAIESE